MMKNDVIGVNGEGGLQPVEGEGRTMLWMATRHWTYEPT